MPQGGSLVQDELLLLTGFHRSGDGEDISGGEPRAIGKTTQVRFAGDEVSLRETKHQSPHAWSVDKTKTRRAQRGRSEGGGGFVEEKKVYRRGDSESSDFACIR